MLAEGLTLFFSAVLVLIVPGWAWLSIFPSQGSDLLERLAEAAGVSMAISAALALVAFLLGGRLTSLFIAGGYGLCLLLIVAGQWRRAAARLDWGALAGLGGFAALLVWRFYQARELVVPAWVDSVHHVFIIQKILENGGIPADLGPQMPVAFFYHFGFHVLAAAYTLLARLDAAQAVLWLGQMLNALAALSIYRLGVVLWADRRRAALAGLLAGFVLQMPAYYLTWGRYTLLSGLVILPLAMAAALELDSAARRGAAPWGTALRLALLTASACLSHYLAAGLLALFVIVLSAAGLREAWQKRRLAALPWRMLGAAALGGLLAAPWLWRTWMLGSRLASLEMAAPPLEDAFSSLTSLYNLLGPARNRLLLLLALPGLFLALRRPRLRPLAVWAGLLALLCLPWGPRFNPFRPDQIAIVLFLPAALLLSELLFAASQALGRIWRPRGGQAALLLATLGLLAWGMAETRNILNPSTVLATQADLNALQWVTLNTPSAARFFINPRLWQTASYRGVDGGYWLLPLTGRQSMLPPVIYGWGPRWLVRQVNDWAGRALRLTGCTPAFWALADEAKLDYVYIKEGYGSLQPSALAGCERLLLVYRKEGVYIYEILAAQP